MGCPLELGRFAVAAGRNADVVLSGQGGDQILGGNIDLSGLALQGHPVRAVRTALSMKVPTRLGAVRRIAHWIGGPIARRYAPAAVLRLVQRRRARRRWMTARFRDALDACVAAYPLRDPQDPDGWLAYHCKSYFFADMASVWGQVSSLTGVAPVDLFRDLDVVRYVAQLDPVRLSDGGLFRGLYRSALAGRIPESVRMRPDKAAGQPMIAAAAVAAGARPMLEVLTRFERLADIGLVEPAPLQPAARVWLDAMDRGERGDRDPSDGQWHVLWALASAEAFLRAVNKEGDFNGVPS
jgi:hypothetical protein